MFLFYVNIALLPLHAQDAADTSLIRQHLVRLTEIEGHRVYSNPSGLNEAAAYIEEIFAQYSNRVRMQPYEVKGNTFQNVIASFGPEHAKRIIVGAHYDVCGRQAGADDNASGVTGLLELARMLQGKELVVRIDLVAYSLEEPPFFRSEYMGSYIHAQSLSEQNVPVIGMVCLEMIGYFDESRKSQTYPFFLMKWLYGGRGNYISLVKKLGSGSFARQFNRRFKRTRQIRTQKISAPAWLTGIDFSDHQSYWKFGYSALMITDTAFYRNKHYHEVGDTVETLNIPYMANVIDGVLLALLNYSDRFQ